MAEFSGGIQIGSGQWDKYSLILRINEISYSVENNTSYESGGLVFDLIRSTIHTMEFQKHLKYP